MNKKLGVFTVNSGKAVVSDPCYKRDGAWQSIVENVANGDWIAEVNQSDEGMWGIRNAELVAYHKENGKPMSSDWSHHTSSIGVDSGQAGFYDFDTYRDDNIAEGKEKADFGRNYDVDDGDAWYRYNCYQTLETKEMANIIEGGVVSSSGYGDGSYTLEIAEKNGKVVGLRLLFLGEVCNYCEEYESNCECSWCDTCHYHEEECDCEFCDDCGELEEDCECEEDEE